VRTDPRDPRIYLRIAGEVRTRIEAGEFDSEGKIPSVRTLMQEYGVAYDTARHAVRTLEDEGLVVRYPGRGYYVTGRS
jgi:DNA-binding GntR family transcriptional regulator